MWATNLRLAIQTTMSHLFPLLTIFSLRKMSHYVHCCCLQSSHESDWRLMSQLLHVKYQKIIFHVTKYFSSRSPSEKSSDLSHVCWIDISSLIVSPSSISMWCPNFPTRTRGESKFLTFELYQKDMLQWQDKRMTGKEQHLGLKVL